MNGYDLSKSWFSFVAENIDVKPIHTSLYFFIANKWNSLFWKKQFGLPTEHTMESINIRSYKTYISALNDLEKYGFIILVERSKNQHTSNIIEVVNNTKATTKATTKALLKATTQSTVQSTVQSEDQSTTQSIVSIIKHINNKQYNKKELMKLKDFLVTFLSENKVKEEIPPYLDFEEHALSKMANLDKTSIRLKYEAWVENDWKDGHGNKIKNWKSKLTNTVQYLKIDENYSKKKCRWSNRGGEERIASFDQYELDIKRLGKQNVKFIEYLD